jgi:hypothetical protein
MCFSLASGLHTLWLGAKLFKWGARNMDRNLIQGAIKQECGGWLKLEFIQQGTPSWAKFGDGHKSLQFGSRKDAGHIEVWLSEHGEKSSKTTHFTMSKADAATLRDLLNQII